MRDDMFKVIVERPRWGSNHAASPKLRHGPHPDCQQIGLKRHVRIGAPYDKSLNENLGPLRRYLRRQRGRVWNDVFRDICAHLDTGHTVKMHVREHIEDIVITRISVGRGGEWMFKGEVLSAHRSWWRWRTLFVDPRDGILKDIAVLDALLAAGVGVRT